MHLDELLPDVPVPGLAIGTMYFGTTVDPAAAHRVLDEAYDRGARFWDTANNYAFWAGGTGDESEECLGAWFAEHGTAQRDDVLVATKVGARPAPGSTDLRTAPGLEPRAVRSQVTDSLRRLGTDHVDVLYAHVDDPSVPFDESLGALSELRDEGLTRAVGVSNLSADRLDEALVVAARTGAGFSALQQRFTYLAPDDTTDLSPHVLLGEDVEERCSRAGIATLGYSPLLSGAYTRSDKALPEGYTTSATAHALAELTDVADEAGIDAGQVVLAWMTQRDHPVIPVVGTSNTAQVAAAVGAVGTSLSTEQMSRLESARSGA